MTQYKKAPDVTRQRIYLETMEHVLTGMDKIILDQGEHGQGVVPYLPLGALRPPHRGGSAQMKSVAGFAAIAAVIAFLIVATASTFTVQQTEQALVLRFGDPVAGRGLITEPGLHFKFPFIENVIYLDNRILDVEAPKQEVLASDNNRLDVDSFLRYRIVDPLKFYQTVGTTERANSQLGFILNSAVRRVLGEANMTDIVRDNRNNLMLKIREQVNQEGGRLGIAATDVRIRRADLPKQISEKVFSRMQSERAREAAEYRAQGSEQAQTITAKADRDVVVLRGEAQRHGRSNQGRGRRRKQPHFRRGLWQGP